MQLNIIILLVFGIFGNGVKSADSDGKDFVFNFMEYSPNSHSVITTTVIVIPSYSDSICTFKYTQTSSNRVVSIHKTAYYSKTNEISFDPNEVLLRPILYGNKFKDFAVKDFRIFVSCTEEVKLIGKLSDPYDGWGDLFNIPSIGNAGDKYIFSVPSQYSVLKGWITILPINQENSISVTIAGYLNGASFSNETIQYDSTIGQDQHYIAVYPRVRLNYNASIIISATSNFFISYMSDYASTSNIGVPSCGITCHEDYITFMPMPVVSKDCSDAISPPDQRMITNDFTTRIYVSPPDVPYDCNEMFTTTVYDKNDNGHQEVISSIGTSTIELTDKSEMASSSNSGQLPMYRLGSILNYPDSLTAYGHFAHYVPSIQEWVTGKTQFYTFAKGCYIEMYADQNGLNPDAIKMDGLPLSSYGYKLNHMNHFTKTYGHFIVPVTGYGLHTIESGANYVMYVICKNVLGAYDAAGYVAGFNKRKVQDSD